MSDFQNRLACVIKADGAIARGYMIEKCDFKDPNEYVITWRIPLQGSVKTNFAGTIGGALDEPVLPGLVTVSLSKDPFQLRVHTFDASGRPAARPFHIACFRDQ